MTASTVDDYLLKANKLSPVNFPKYKMQLPVSLIEKHSDELFAFDTNIVDKFKAQKLVTFRAFTNNSIAQ